MELNCPVCDYTGALFKPGGTLRSASGKRKLRACPNCNSDEWSRLVAAWISAKLRLPRNARVLALSAPLALRAALVKLKGVSFVDAETGDLAGGAFAADAFDLVAIGENWTYASRDISIAAKLHDVLRAKGWLVAMPQTTEEAEHRQKQLSQLGFTATTDAGVERERLAVDLSQPFLAAQKVGEADQRPRPAPAEDGNRLVWFVDDGPAPAIRPGPLARDWMDATPQKFAYRCLPLNIANCQGWELLNPSGFAASWNGAAAIEAITVIPDEKDVQPLGRSHFGSGILTFSVAGLFRTPQGIDLCVTGPVNRPKPGIHGLTGVIETDWSEFGFTMNWLFTDKNREVRFEKDEPFCMIYPIPRTLAESMDPVVVQGSANPGLWRNHMAHRMSRADFNNALKIPHSLEQAKGWQRSYFVGPQSVLQPEHRTKAKVKPFRPIST